jgi:hypothetical protein
MASAQGTRLLQQSLSVLHDAEASGAETLAQLRHDHDTLVRVRDRASDISASLAEARASLRRMESRRRWQRALWCAGGAIIVAAVIALIWVLVQQGVHA